MATTIVFVVTTTHETNTTSLWSTTITNNSEETDDESRNEVVKEWVFLFLTLFAMIMGLVGNVLIIGAVFAERRLRVLSNAFIVNLAIADLIVSTFINAFALVGLFLGEAFFDSHPHLCEFVGAMCIICCVCSLWSIASIALNRFIAIRHRLSYRRFYNRGNLWAHLLVPWVGGILLDIPNLTGWNSHEFIDEFMMCTYNIHGSLSYVIFLTIMAVGIPLLVISFSYIGIYMYAYASSHELKKFANSIPGRAHAKKKLRQTDAKLLRSILILVLAYAIFWFPESLLVLADWDHVVPDSVYMSVAFLAHFNSSINSVIYGLTNENFRKGYRKFMSVALQCRRIDCSFNPEATRATSEASSAMVGAEDHSGRHKHARNGHNIAGRFTCNDRETHDRRECLQSEPCNI